MVKRVLEGGFEVDGMVDPEAVGGREFQAVFACVGLEDVLQVRGVLVHEVPGRELKAGRHLL